jgi:hypothetical protein
MPTIYIETIPRSLIQTTQISLVSLNSECKYIIFGVTKLQEHQVYMVYMTDWW